MRDQISADEPAFPHNERNHHDGSHFRTHPGMSLRAYVATQLCAGVCAQGGFIGMHQSWTPAARAEAVLEMADALIAALHKEPGQ